MTFWHTKVGEGGWTPPPTSTRKIFGRFFYFFRFPPSSWGPVDTPTNKLSQIRTRTDFSRPHFHPFFPLRHSQKKGSSTSTQNFFCRFFYFFRFRTSSWGPLDIPSKNLVEIPTRTDFSRPHFHPFFPSLFYHFSFEQKLSFGHSRNPWSGQNRSKFFCRVSQRYCSETCFRCIRTFPPNI